MTHPPDSSPTAHSATVPLPSWRALAAALGILMVPLVLLVAVVVGLAAVFHSGPFPPGQLRHEIITIAILAPIVLTIVVIGLQVRHRILSATIVVLAWVIMGIGSQFQWYGTPRWGPHAGIANMVFVALWYGALGGGLQYFVAHRSPNRSARFAARLAEFEAAKRARVAKGPAR